LQNKGETMSLKIAAVAHPYKGSVEDTIAYTTKLIAQAAKQGAELVVLQELHQSPYFCQSESVENFKYAATFEEDKRYWSKVAKENSVVLVASLFEQRAPGLYHNTAVVFDSDGSEAGFYRKMHIPDDPGFYEKFYFTPGDRGFEPIETSLGKIGVLVCWDQWYPEAARIMALRGAKMLIYPTAIGFDPKDDKEEQNRQIESWITIQRSHAIANGIPVVASNRWGYEHGEGEDAIAFWGNSFVAGPQGEILAKASEPSQEIIYAEIDFERTKAVRDIWPFFRDRRIDAYKSLEKRYDD